MSLAAHSEGLAGLLGLWLLWSLVFFAYWRGATRHGQIARMTQRLIRGTFLELFAATAVFAWNPHEESCYCGRGSYLGLVLGGTVLAWTFGPGILLLFLGQKRRRRVERTPGGNGLKN